MRTQGNISIQRWSSRSPAKGTSYGCNKGRTRKNKICCRKAQPTFSQMRIDASSTASSEMKKEKSPIWWFNWRAGRRGGRRKSSKSRLTTGWDRSARSGVRMESVWLASLASKYQATACSISKKITLLGQFNSEAALRNNPEFVRTETVAGLTTFVLRSRENDGFWFEQWYSPKTGGLALKLVVHDTMSERITEAVS